MAEVEPKMAPRKGSNTGQPRKILQLTFASAGRIFCFSLQLGKMIKDYCNRGADMILIFKIRLFTILKIVI